MQDSNHGFGKHFFLSKSQQKHVFKSLAWIIVSVFGFSQQYGFSDEIYSATNKVGGSA